MTIRLVHGAVLGLLTATAAAQCKGLESSGPFAGTPAAVVVDGVGFSEEQALLKPPGFEVGYASFPSLPATRPAFDLPLLFAKWGATKAMSVDAMSIGEDWVYSTCGGQVAVPNGVWAALVFSVKRGTIGKPGTPLGVEAAAGSPESDLFSYVLPGSQLPGKFVQRTQRAIDSTESLLPAGVDIAALDLFMTYYTLDDRVAEPAQNGGMMPDLGQFFFSLTAASAMDAPLSWFRNENGMQTVPSGGSILRTEWNKAQGWSEPRVWRSHAELQLGPEEDVDALAIDLERSVVLFSTDISIVQRDPLLVYSWICPNDAIAPYAIGGDTVASSAGLTGSDDINAICAEDPETLFRINPVLRPNNAHYGLGTPVDTTPQLPFTALNGSGFRAFDGTNVVIRPIMVGRPGGQQNGSGAAVALLTPPGSLLVVQPQIVYAGFARPASSLCGDPLSAPFGIPVPVDPGLLDVDIALRWLALDTTVGASGWGEAFPVLMRL